MRGSCSGPNLRPAIRIRSRFEERYPAKKIDRVIFASSPGCSENGPTWIQMRAPLIVAPRPGISGSSSRTMDASRAIYVKRRRTRWSFTAQSTRAPTRMAMAVHISCRLDWDVPLARSMRWIIARPREFSATVIGSITGSAYLAKMRRSTWMTRAKAPMIPIWIRKFLLSLSSVALPTRKKAAPPTHRARSSSRSSRLRRGTGAVCTSVIA